MPNLQLANLDDQELDGIPGKPEIRKAAERFFKLKQKLKEKRKEVRALLKPIEDECLNELDIIAEEIRKSKRATQAITIEKKTYVFRIERTSGVVWDIQRVVDDNQD